MHEVRLDAWHGSAWPVRYISCVSFSHRGNSLGPNRSRGGISRTTRYTRGLVIRGIFFPPSQLYYNDGLPNMVPYPSYSATSEKSR